MATRFCPRCGTPRVGNFRYCRSCQLDFDALDVPAAADAPDVPGAPVEGIASAAAPTAASVPSSTPPEATSSSRETMFTGAIAIILGIGMVVAFILIMTGTLTATH